VPIVDPEVFRAAFSFKGLIDYALLEGEIVTRQRQPYRGPRRR
jgi:hypothetical protein